MKIGNFFLCLHNRHEWDWKGFFWAIQMKTHAMNHGIWIRPALIVQLPTSFSVPVLLLRLLRNFFAQETKKKICNAVVVTESCWRNPFLACIISHSASLLLCLNMYNFLIYARLEKYFSYVGMKMKRSQPFHWNIWFIFDQDSLDNFSSVTLSLFLSAMRSRNFAFCSEKVQSVCILYSLDTHRIISVLNNSPTTW